MTVGAPLRDRWMALATRWGAPPAAARSGFESIAARYAEPARHYHTLDHVASVLAAIDELAAAEPVPDRAAVELAGWLHDVVYDPTRSDNESASAELARRSLPLILVPDHTVAEVVRLIELTAGHVVDPDDADAAVLIDADLSVLGAPADDYDRYASAIRLEYGHVADDAFRAGRRAVLADLVARPRLFVTGTADARWAASARTNLVRELDALASASTDH